MIALSVLLLLVALACGIVLAVKAVIGRAVELGVIAAGVIALAWAGLIFAGVHIG